MGLIIDGIWFIIKLIFWSFVAGIIYLLFSGGWSSSNPWIRNSVRLSVDISLALLYFAIFLAVFGIVLYVLYKAIQFLIIPVIIIIGIAWLFLGFLYDWTLKPLIKKYVSKKEGKDGF